MTARFQFMPPLSAEDYAALKADIKARGVKIPIEYDQNGEVIDGHHRVKICRELGISDWPRTVRTYADDAERRTNARALNIARRHLDREAKRALIEAELKDRPEATENQIARDLGVSPSTVASVRQKSNFQVGNKVERREASGRKARGRKPRAAAPRASEPVKEGDAIDTSRTPRSAAPPRASVTAKASSKSRRLNESAGARAAALLILDDGKSYAEVETETGMSNIVLRAAVAREEGRREAYAEMGSTELSPSAQQKLDAAIRVKTRELERSFDDRVERAAAAKYKTEWKPQMQQRLDEAARIMRHRVGHMPRRMFRIILSLLSPDSRNSVSDARMAEALNAFRPLERLLVGEAELETEKMTL